MGSRCSVLGAHLQSCVSTLEYPLPPAFSQVVNLSQDLTAAFFKKRNKMSELLWSHCVSLQITYPLNRGRRRGFFTTNPTHFQTAVDPEAFSVIQHFFISLSNMLPLVIQAASSATSVCAFSSLPAAVCHSRVVIRVFSKRSSTLTAWCHQLRGPLQPYVCAYMCMFCHVPMFWRLISVVSTTWFGEGTHCLLYMQSLWKGGCCIPQLQ